MMDSGPAKENRLWIVSELYYPEPTSTGYILTGLAEGLVRRGRKVSALCGRPSYAAREQKTAWRENHGGVEIYRCRATRWDKNVLWKRVVNLVTISISLFFNALRRIRRGDCVLVITNPPVLPFLVSAVCRWKKVAYVLSVHDIYPEFAVVAGALRPRGWIARLWGAGMRRQCRNADQIIVLGRDMQELIRRKRERNPEDVHVVTNWADVEEIVPLPRNENRLLAECGLSEKFVVQCAGNMGPVHDVNLLVRAAASLTDLPDLHFLIIGSGARMPWLKQRIRDLGLTNVTVLPPQPRGNSCEFLNACEVAISIFVSGMYGVSVPSRMYNILAAGKPVVAATESQSEFGRLIQEEQVGWVVPPGDSQAFALALREAYGNRYRLAEMGRRARAAVEQKYRLDGVVQVLDQVISRLADRQTHSDAPSEK